VVGDKLILGHFVPGDHVPDVVEPPLGFVIAQNAFVKRQSVRGGGTLWSAYVQRI
jgi:hypothetical protein